MTQGSPATLWRRSRDVLDLHRDPVALLFVRFAVGWWAMQSDPIMNQSADLRARSGAALARAQQAIARCDLVLAHAQALAWRLDDCRIEVAAARVATRPDARRRKRNKLFYKNRWLVSANVVAALHRAGVDCNIVVSPRATG